VLITFFSNIPVHAQEVTSAGPVYIVQEGDSLWDIAYRFHVTQQALQDANGLQNPNQITIGQALVIPGLEGIQGTLTTENVSYGETLHSLSLKYQMPEQMLRRLNHITSPSELYAGYSLVILQNKNLPTLGERVSLSAGQSLLELAILNNTDPWSVLAVNRGISSSTVLPGEVLRTPAGEDSGPGGLPAAISSVAISPMAQGQTTEIQLEGTAGLSIGGTLLDHKLGFFQDENKGYIALQGVNAMQNPGLYPLSIQVSSPDGIPFDFSQNVSVTAGQFRTDVPLTVDPATMDPKVTQPENDLWASISAPQTTEKLWVGTFGIPVDPVYGDCFASRFGSRRSYNGSEYIYYHTGLDFCGQVGQPVYAAASGIVAYTGSLTVRGNATVIDHGWGVYTAYMHQSEILVKAGDHVEKGQLIGLVGNTGRVEGPHLHFEVLVGGVPVNPLDWLTQEYP
jgi:murein DD-endopeptidase MepM/ murein hydrolase activator NlpD